MPKVSRHLWRHRVSRDMSLKRPNFHGVNYEETLNPIVLKVSVFLSREEMYVKIAMTSSWPHRLICYDLLKCCIISILLTISGERNKIFSIFFLGITL